MADDLELGFPVHGRDDSLERAKQPPLTTVAEHNCRVLNPRTGAAGGARRAGSRRTCPVPAGDGGATALASVVYGTSHIDWAELPAPETAWKKLGPSSGNGTAVRCGAIHTFVLEGGTHVSVRNREGVLVAKVAIPLQQGQVCRALAHDDFQFYVAVSDGGVQSRAKVWAYKDDPYKGWTIQWVLAPAKFVEKMQVVDGVLYLLANDVEENRAWVRAYGNLDALPQEDWFAQVPAPGTCMDVSVKGDVLAGTSYNSARGEDPRVGNGPRLDDEFADFTLEALDNIALKRRCHLRAEDIDVANGAEVPTWEDFYGSPRKVSVATDPVYVLGIFAEVSGAQPADNDTITFTSNDGIIAETFRFKNVPAALGDILIGANIAATLTNLVTAVSTGGNTTTVFAGTAPSVLVTNLDNYAISTNALFVARRSSGIGSGYVNVTKSSATLTVPRTVARFDQTTQPTAATLNKVGLGGRPELLFNGRSNKYTTGPNASSTVATAKQQNTLLPSYGASGNRDTSAKFALFMVCRPFKDPIPSCILAQRNNIVWRRVVANRGTTLGTPVQGSVVVVDHEHAAADVQYTTSFETTIGSQNFALIEFLSHPSTTAADNDIEFYFNGTAITGAPVDASANDGIFATVLGQGNDLAQNRYDDGWYRGGISEVFVLQANGDDLLSTAQRQLIEGYFHWKYGAQALLPALHPYYTKPPPPPGTSTIPFHRAQQLTSPLPIVVKISGLTQEITCVAASTITGAATIGGLGSGLKWNTAGTAFYTIGAPVLMAGPGADTASIRKVVDKGTSFSFDTADGAWSAELGASTPVFQQETFSALGLELAVDGFDNAWIPFHADRYQGAHLAFLAFDKDGNRFLAPEADDQALSYSIAIQQPIPDLSDTSPALTRPDLIVIGERNEATTLFELLSNPSNLDSVSFSGVANGVMVTETYVFVVTLTATPFEVLIGAEPGETYANLKAAVNRGAGESTLYGVGTPRSELVSAASIVAGKLQFVARRYEADTTTSVSGAGLVFDPVTFAKELAA